MKERIKKVAKNNFFVIAVIIILIISIALMGTYAWFTWQSQDDTTLTMTIGNIADVTISSGGNVNINDIGPVFNYEDGVHTSLSLTNKTSKTLGLNLSFDITSISDNLKKESFKYKVLKVDGDTKTEIAGGDFSTAQSGQTLPMAYTLAASRANSYDVVFYIDANVENDISMMNGSISGKVMVDVQEFTYGTVAETITSIYNTSPKSIAVNNSIEYNYTKSSLMNDRLGGTTTSLDAGNIRYYGATPNNYIYFNCSDYSNQSNSTCEKWRIIGIFKDMELADGTKKDLVKIIRNDSLERPYSWDYKVNGSSTSYTNDWSTATLNTLLNDTYYNAGTTNYYNNSPTATAVDFTSTGIKNEETRNMIVEASWNLGGWNNDKVYSNQIYNYERGTVVYTGMPTTWNGKIALMYPSDYGYAADFMMCTLNLHLYSDCTNDNWLYNSEQSWLLTPFSENPRAMWRAMSLGDVNVSMGLGGNSSRLNMIRPVLFLPSEKVIEAGDGTSSNPFRISAS